MTRAGTILSAAVAAALLLSRRRPPLRRRGLRHARPRSAGGRHSNRRAGDILRLGDGTFDAPVVRRQTADHRRRPRQPGGRRLRSWQRLDGFGDDVTISDIYVTGSGRSIATLDSGIAVAKADEAHTRHRQPRRRPTSAARRPGGIDTLVADNTIVGRTDLRMNERGPASTSGTARLTVERNRIRRGRDGVFISDLLGGDLPRTTSCRSCASPSIPCTPTTSPSPASLARQRPRFRLHVLPGASSRRTTYPSATAPTGSSSTRSTSRSCATTTRSAAARSACSSTTPTTTAWRTTGSRAARSASTSPPARRATSFTGNAFVANARR